MKFVNLILIAFLSITVIFSPTLQAQPEIVVEPAIIELALESGEREELAIEITNPGDQNLIFTIENEIISEPVSYTHLTLPTN